MCRNKSANTRVLRREKNTESYRGQNAERYALQFHQVVVNLCSSDKLGWGANPTLGVFEASVTCEKLGSEASSLVV